MHHSLRNQQRMLKNPLFHNVWEGGKKCIRISIKSLWGLFWAETHPSSKFWGNLFWSFSVILLTNQLKKKKKNNRHKHTVKMAPYNLYSRVQVTGSPEIPNWLETTSPPYVSSICFSSLGECCNAVPLWSSRNVFVDFTQLSTSVRVSR